LAESGSIWGAEIAGFVARYGTNALTPEGVPNGFSQTLSLPIACFLVYTFFDVEDKALLALL